MKLVLPIRPPRPRIGWKGFPLPLAAGIPSRWPCWVSSASAASCALPAVRLPAVQWLTAALAVAALAAACVAIFTVGRVAYPVSEATDGASAVPGAAAAAARLRAGIRLTIVALILAVIAALSGWRPAASATAAVAVTATSGQAWCGPLVSGPAGAVSVRTANGVITVPARAVAQVRPVAQC